jgi:hypothetical protein
MSELSNQNLVLELRQLIQTAKQNAVIAVNAELT